MSPEEIFQKQKEIYDVMKMIVLLFEKKNISDQVAADSILCLYINIHRRLKIPRETLEKVFTEVLEAYDLHEVYLSRGKK